MRIGELSRRAGVSERALRYYEEQGLLHPKRRPSGYRDFSEDDVHVVRRIRLLLAAGLSTATIAEALPCMVEGSEGLAAGCPELLDGLAGEHDRITAAIGELESARALLATIITTPLPSQATTQACADEGEGTDTRTQGETAPDGGRRPALR